MFKTFKILKLKIYFFFFKTRNESIFFVKIVIYIICGML